MPFDMPFVLEFGDMPSGMLSGLEFADMLSDTLFGMFYLFLFYPKPPAV